MLTDLEIAKGLRKSGIWQERTITEKAFKIGKDSATGSLILFFGKMISTAILAVGSIVLARLILPADYGLYSISLVPALMLGLFQDWGISSALTRFIAQYKTKDKSAEIYDVIVAGMTFELVTGVTLSLVSVLIANNVASAIYHRPESSALISVASITILSNAIFVASQAAFVGLERMQYSSLVMIFQAIAQTAITPLLVLVGYGALGATLGYTFSTLVAGIAGALILLFILMKKIARKGSGTKIRKTLTMMLHYGIPLSISSILNGFLIQFYGFMMAFYISNDTILGNYRIAVNFAVLITFFTIPISTALFPAFARVDPKNERELLRNVFSSSVKYSSLILIPATMAVMVLSRPMISTLFGDKWTDAPFLLVLYVTANLLVVLGSLSMGSLLLGIGETRMVMKLNLVTLAVGSPLAFILIPTLGIIGVVIGSVLASVPSTLYGLYWMWKRYQTKADLKSSAKIFAASAIAAITTYASVSLFHFADWITLTIGITVFFAVYILSASMIGAVNRTDIQNLKGMLSGLGIVSKIIKTLLDLAEKVTDLLHWNQIV